MGHDNKIVVEIYNTKQGKHENVRAYSCRLTQLVVKLEKELANGLKKRWFIEGLRQNVFSWKKKNR